MKNLIEQVNKDSKQAIEVKKPTLEISTSLNTEQANDAIVSKEESLLRKAKIAQIVENWDLLTLEKQHFTKTEFKSNFDLDFNLNMDKFKGLFNLFNNLTKGKSQNVLTKAFFECGLEKKYKFGKDFNGITLLGFLPSELVLNRLASATQYRESEIKLALKGFNTYVKNENDFLKANERGQKINALILDYANNKIDAKKFVEGLESLTFMTNLKHGFEKGLSDKAKTKVATVIYNIKKKQATAKA